MCNASHHPAGCNCGFGPSQAGLGEIAGKFGKVTYDALSTVFPLPKISEDGKDFGSAVYNKLFKDPKLSDEAKARAQAFIGKVNDSALKTMSDGLWGAYETAYKASKGLPQSAFLDKLAGVYTPILTNALPLDVMYENKAFWDVLYGDKKKSAAEWSTINHYRKERGDDSYDVLVSSPFGPRVIDGKKQNHTGVDLNTIGEDGVIAHAAAGGKVMQTIAKDKTGGDIVRMIVRADDGSACLLQTCHHNKTFVKEGDTIEPGQAIAEISNKGKTTGKHLDLKVGYAEKPPEASVKVAMKKGFKASAYGEGVSYKDGVLTVKGAAAAKLKDKLAAQAEDKSAVEGLFKDYKPRKYTYDELAGMTPAQFRKTITWKDDIHYKDPVNDSPVKGLVPSVIGDMKRQIVARKVAREITDRQKSFAQARPGKPKKAGAKQAGAKKAQPGRPAAKSGGRGAPAPMPAH